MNQWTGLPISQPTARLSPFANWLWDLAVTLDPRCIGELVKAGMSRGFWFCWSGVGPAWLRSKNFSNQQPWLRILNLGRYISYIWTSFSSSERWEGKKKWAVSSRGAPFAIPGISTIHRLWMKFRDCGSHTGPSELQSNFDKIPKRFLRKRRFEMCWTRLGHELKRPDN